MMKLIKNLGRKTSKNGKYKYSYGLFECFHCKTKVELTLGGGKRNQSCGCHVNIKHGNRSLYNKYYDLYQVWRNMQANNNGDYKPSNCRFVTHAVNMRNSSITKLDWKKVKKIRELYKAGLFFQEELAKRYNVTQTQISRIIRNESWRDINLKAG